MAKNTKPVYEKITFPKVPPYNAVREYLFSKQATEGMAKKFENGDCINDRSVDISHYVAQRELAHVSKRLDQMRNSSETQRKTMKAQWADLQNKEMSFRENFIKFNDFVKENQEKRERAANKIIEQTALAEERTLNVEELRAKCDDIISVKKILDKKISDFRIYENYLKEVIENEPTMQIVTDLLRRYEALLSARKELNIIQQRDMLKLEKAKSNLMKLYEEKNFIIMGLNNQIANLQERYENANIKALESENLVTQIKNNAVKQMNEIDEVKFAIWNVYVHMAISKKHSIKIKRENVEEQMLYLNRTLTEINKVNKILRKKMAKK